MHENYEFMAYRPVELPEELRFGYFLGMPDLMERKKNRKISAKPMHPEYILIYYFAGYWFSEN